MGFKTSVIDRLDAALYDLRRIRLALEGIHFEARRLADQGDFGPPPSSDESEAARGRARAEELDAEVGEVTAPDYWVPGGG